MNLDEILKRYEEAAKIAAINPDEQQYVKSRSGIETAKAQAQRELVDLKAEYQEAVLSNGVAIFLKGQREKQVEFARLVSEMQEAPVVDAEDFYRAVASSVEQTIGHTREFGPTQGARLHSAMLEETANIGVKLIRPLTIQEHPILPDFNATLNHVRTLVRSQVGDSINAEAVKKTVADKALAMGYSGKSVPVIIVNALSAEAVGIGQLFGKGRVNYEIKDEDIIDKEYIANAFKTVKNQIKKNKPTE